MPSDLIVNVRQLSSYPALAASDGTETLLVQQAGLGGPYASIGAAALVSTALNNAALGVGFSVPGNAAAGQVFAGPYTLPAGYSLLWNNYWNGSQNINWLGGLAARLGFDVANLGWTFELAPVTGAGQPCDFVQMMALSTAGNLSLPFGTLTVARDPAGRFDVATLNYVANNTVASFNQRTGQVTLSQNDIYQALCLNSPIASEAWVNDAIGCALQNLLTTCPLVNRWNGRTGSVYLTLSDITCVFFQPGQQPVAPTPPITSDDNSIATTQWVVAYIANEFAGGGTTLATQAWVLANTVNSFNGRQGPVTLTGPDVFDVGAAPTNSPNFSGIPTAPTAAVGQATGQIATTAFVQQAITNNTAGVSTFNTRSGDVVLTNADVVNAGGLANPSPTLTGSPVAPTQPPGTNLPVIATCEFVQAALSSGAVTSFNSRTGAVVLTLADVTSVGGAPLVSPAFSSVPTAPTAAPGTNTVQLATCAFVTNAVTNAGGVSSFNSRTGAVDLIANDISAAGGLVNPSVNLTGSPTATTATAGDNSTRIATTAFVTTALSSGAVSSFNTRTGAVTLQGADITAAGGALLASPAFTGAPTAPTAAPATNNTQIATTAYVTAAILADTTGVTSFNTRTGAVVLTTADITGAGGAPLNSPGFTGVPLGPTATAGTSTTQLATTAFVQAAIASSGVSSFNARTGAVTLIANDISAAGGALLASPTFTGTPAAPTAAPGTNTTQLATTAFVAAALGAYLPLAGGTLAGALAGTSLTMTGSVTANQFVTGSATSAGVVYNNQWLVTPGAGSGGGTPATPSPLSLGFVPAGTDSSVNASAWTGVLIQTGNAAGTAFLVRTTWTPGSVAPVHAVTVNSAVNTAAAFLNGTASATWSVTSSDSRLKHNRADPEKDALGIINRIKVYQADYQHPASEMPLEHLDFTILADDIETALPAAYMAPPDENGYASLHPIHMIAALWRAVQQLSEEVMMLRTARA